jgi:hypothetical protein
MLNEKELKVFNVFNGANDYRLVVRVVHMPSGIGITRSAKTHMEAYSEAIKVLKVEVELWNRIAGR